MKSYKLIKKFNKLLLLLVGLLLFSACFPGITGISTANKEWVGTWRTAPQLVEERNNPPAPGLSNNTLRQIVRVSLGGDSLRVRFSDEFSTTPVTMKSVHIAVSADSSAIILQTDRELKFNGNSEVIIKPGSAIISDPSGFHAEPRSNITITIYFGDTSPDVTGHPGSRTTSYIVTGNKVSAIDLPDAVKTDHWYIISGIDVTAYESAAAVVALGNSITDGRGSGTNKQNRWPDELARRLQENPETREVAVLNQGIGGNCVLRDCLGPSALSRFERDVLSATKAHWLIILEGINDIGQIPDAESEGKTARDLIAAYEQMIDSAHAKSMKVYGATILPFAGSFYDAPYRQTARDTVNEWIRKSGRFDAVIDLDMALRDPGNPLYLLPGADSGDHLHPNETGYRMMAEAVDIGLFK
ncbi:MAG TPA: SGNH/GDSL hydrolase family protein [Ignavibacteriaceae bacterium]|nr:SGNH/GDSL hydrolase family protein [Ignavibacteriaceae bacterium]